MPARKIDLANVVDTAWIKQSFMMDASSISDTDMQFRTLSTAQFSFQDTTPGGNEAINPPPQFTRYADLRVGGLGKDQAEGTYRPSESRGIGRYYYEAYTESTTHLYMRFGVPQYNSLSNFFTNFYSAEAAAMARTGRGTSAFFKMGQAVGFIVGIVPRTLIYMYNVARWFGGKQSSKYYYMKPTMLLYWNAVTTILNTIATNMGIISPLIGANKSLAQQVLNDSADTGPDVLTSGRLNTAMHNMLPEIFEPSGGIDAYKLASRYQRLNMSYREAGYEAIANALVDDATSNNSNVVNITKLQAALATFLTQRITSDPAQMTTTAAQANNGSASGTVFTGLTAYMQAYMNCVNQTSWSPDDSTVPVDNTPVGSTDTSSGSTDTSNSTGTTQSTSSDQTSAPGQTGTVSAPTAETIFDPSNNADPGFNSSYFKDFQDFLVAEFQSGSAFVAFRVDGSGTVNESFSNSVKESDIQSKINSISASNRETRFTLEGGNISDNTVVKFAEGAVNAVKDFAVGTLMGAGIDITGLSALAGSAFVDIPKTWDASSANLPSMDFTIQLRSPYGNKISRLLNLYLPLAMLLAGSLPLATGKQSYTSPFLCEAYCRGRIAIRLGMITQLSITRGAGNIGWTEDGAPLGIDVSFSITDMSSVMYMPVAANFSTLDAAKMTLAQLVAGAEGTAINGTVGLVAPAAAQQANQNLSTVANATAASLTSSMWDDDNTYSNYMAILGSLTMVDQVSPSRKWKLRMTNQMANFNTWKSQGHLAMVMANTWLGRHIVGFSRAPRIGQSGA